METTQALKWAGSYLTTWLAATLVGGSLAVGGVALGGLAPIGLGELTPAGLRLETAAPSAGLALIAVGVLVWKFGSALALVLTVALAVEAEFADRLNAEAMKSDILSVLDDRLADMHNEVEETRLLVDRLSRDDAASEFEFQGVDRE